MLPSRFFRVSASQSWFASILVTTLAISAFEYRINPVTSTILAPKARICFNSMASSFQSECVYCDSRLYASTIAACTGQPMLANNVTQAQAFCIATACLQPARPFWSNSKEPDYYEHRRFARSAVRKTETTGSEATTTTAASEATTLIAATSTVEPPPRSSSPQPEVATTMASEESRPEEWPNFNRMYSQIYNSFASRQPLVWRPASEFWPIYPLPAQPARQQPLRTLASRVGELMESISNKLIESKRLYYNSHLWPGRADFWSSGQMQPLGWFRRRRPLERLFQEKRLPVLERPLYSMAVSTSNQDQTGKAPTVLGRRRRRKKRSLSLKPLTLSINKNKQYQASNGTLTAQLNKSVNGTTSGNVAFVLNKPGSAYIWNNPLTRVLTRNNPNKSLQWQFGRPAAAAAAATPAASAAPRPAAPAASGQVANPQPARQVPLRPVNSNQYQQQPEYQQEVGLSRPGNQLGGGSAGLMTSSYVVPANRQQQN